jgi:translation elongation factor P/translation initiation factor 5A
MEFLYNDGDDYYFMDQNTYEQTALKRDTLGDAVEYLTPTCSSKSASTMARPSASSCPPRLR